MRGIAYVSFQNSEYLAPESTESLTTLGSTGANYVSVLATWYMPSPTATQIEPDAVKSPSDAAVRKAISDAHARGLKVMLKPHVDVVGGFFRGTIVPTSTAAWFVSYHNFILHYAQIAEETNCELYCVGCELISMSGSTNHSEWTTTIQAIRQVYSGPLTYAANANSPNDEFTKVSFWAQLDFAGLDVYTPLTNSTSPTIAQLIDAWSLNRFGLNQLQAFRNFAASVGKPVFFTEMGYQSADGTNMTPNDVPNRMLDLQEQADCYEAALTVFGTEPWLEGIFFWGWEATPIDSPTDSHFSARGKPAQAVLQAFYQAANRAPIAGSGVVATPALPKAGVAVQLSCMAADADGDALSFAWDFGNGTTSTEAQPSVVYSAAGTYTVTVVVSDGKGGSATAQLELEVFTDFLNLAVKSSSIALSFGRSSKDSLKIAGSLPLADATPLLNAPFSFNIGGIAQTVILDSRGKAMNGARTVSVKVGPKARKGLTVFSIALKNSLLAQSLADEGLINADLNDQPVTVAVAIEANGVLYQHALSLLYSARKDRTARTKKP